ncbi:MAG: hypothetical protein WCQ53_09075 [bacterium]
MKKILFVAIVTLGLVGCAGGGRSKADTGTAEDQLLAKCGDHAQLVTDKCVCLTGYEMDNQGACVAIAKLDLAAPVLTSTTLAAAGTLTSAKNAGNILFNDSKDVDGTLAPSAEIHYIYKVLATGVKAVCTNYADTIDCQSPLYVATTPTVLTAVGSYCVKAIACDNGDGKYTESPVMLTLVKVQ